MTTLVTVDFADGKYAFNLGKIHLLHELQEKTGVGPQALYRRVSTGDWLTQDLMEIIRLGLIGGGATPVQAATLVERYVAAQPLARSIPLAVIVLAAVLVGASDEGNARGEATG